MGKPDDPLPPEALESLEGQREGEEKKAKPASESQEKTAQDGGMPKGDAAEVKEEL
jgi:hypothetical protein